MLFPDISETTLEKAWTTLEQTNGRLDQERDDRVKKLEAHLAFKTSLLLSIYIIDFEFHKKVARLLLKHLNESQSSLLPLTSCSLSFVKKIKASRSVCSSWHKQLLMELGQPVVYLDQTLAPTESQRIQDIMMDINHEDCCFNHWVDRCPAKCSDGTDCQVSHLANAFQACPTEESLSRLLKELEEFAKNSLTSSVWMIVDDDVDKIQKLRISRLWIHSSLWWLVSGGGTKHRWRQGYLTFALPEFTAQEGLRLALNTAKAIGLDIYDALGRATRTVAIPSESGEDDNKMEALEKWLNKTLGGVPGRTVDLLVGLVSGEETVDSYLESLRHRLEWVFQQIPGDNYSNAKRLLEKLDPKHNKKHDDCHGVLMEFWSEEGNARICGRPTTGVVTQYQLDVLRSYAAVKPPKVRKTPRKRKGTEKKPSASSEPALPSNQKRKRNL